VLHEEKRIDAVLILAWLAAVSPSLFAQTPAPGEEAAAENVTQEPNVVSYQAGYFSRYQPNSALDMLEQLPGFRIAVSGELRGYGSDSGNVLIDGRRPGSKQVSVSSILDRIPASQVERIELIRGPVRDIELLGEPEVANVVLRTDVPAAIRVFASGYRNSDTNKPPLFANLSLSDRWRGIDYNAGLIMHRVVYSDTVDEDIVDGAGNLLEERFEDGAVWEFEGTLDLTATAWWGDTLLNWNSQIGLQDGSEDLVSRRIPRAPVEDPHNEIFGGYSDEFMVEVGLTAERSLAPDLQGSLLVYFNRENEDTTRTQHSIDANGTQTADILKESYQREREGIIRTEFEWGGWSAHTVRLNLEGSYNLVDNEDILTEDTGGGPVTMFVPGANTAIEEYRGDILLKDTWSLGKFELDYGMGAEATRLNQSGDANLARKLVYLKPHWELSYTSSEAQKIRFRLARDVAQLIFSDYISASFLADEDVALGNPNLSPETTWVSELGYEQRFGRQTVFNLTLFYHRITDVQDLIPVTQTEESPGNIGDGRRYGIEFKSTLQLDWVGLHNARLDINSRWQDSSVTDPVTGEKRELTATVLADDNSSSNIFTTDGEYVYVFDFRQDFEAAKLAWGWDVTFESQLPIYKVNELDLRDRGTDLNLFVETTRWFGMKLRLEFNNVFDRTVVRERTTYTGARGLSPILRRQLQDRTDGSELGLSLSGSF
jgi:hypothetical protein